MKICPLITQVALIDESERELLVGVADDADLSESPPRPEPSEVEGDDAEDLFMNPDGEPLIGEDDIEEEEPETSGDEPAGESAGTEDPDAVERAVRFIAKSARGEVSCLAERCRFHDDERGECRIELMLAANAAPRDEDEGESVGELIEPLRDEIGKAWDFQQKSTGEIIGLFKELEERTTEAAGALRELVENGIAGVREQLAEVTEESRMIIESITDTLVERNEDLDKKLTESRDHIDGFRGEVTEWKRALEENIGRIEKSIDENRRLTGEVSDNNAEIMKLVENQKKTLEQEEQRRQISEAKRLNNAGVVAYHNGQYEKALELFGKALDINPGFTEGYNNLGLTYTEMHEEEKATEAFKKAIELNPDLAATYNNLGYVFYRLGSYTEAIEMYNEAIGRSSDNSSAYTNLGNAYYKLDRIDDAIGAWRTALEVDPSNEKAQRNLKRFHAEAPQES